MADVVEEEEFNKMNPTNIAMVFAPNMTQVSDPLTALMHAVQVMNLLKTLIIKTLREREETDTDSYSPMSSRSSDHQTDENFDSQQEMEMESSSELSGPTADYDENPQSSHRSEDGDEVRSLCEIEECFLRQLDVIKTAKSSLEILDEPTGQLDGDCLSPQSCSGFNGESGTSFSDTKNGNSGFSTSGGEEDSGKCIVAVEQDMDTESPVSKACANMDEMEMVDKFVEPAQTSIASGRSV